MSGERIPQTDSVRELASFWETHDLADVEDDLEEINEEVFRREPTVQVPLPSADADAVRRLATSRGLEPAELIREWVTERVRAAT